MLASALMISIALASTLTGALTGARAARAAMSAAVQDSEAPAAKEPAAGPRENKEPAEEAPAAKPPVKAPAAKPPVKAPAAKPPLKATGKSLGQAPFWAEKKNAARALPVVAIDGPRELLETYGIDESQLRRFEDGQPLTETGREPLVKVLYRLPSFGADRIGAWREPAPPWKKMIATPQEFRGRIFAVSGTVVKIEATALEEPQASRLEFGGYYTVTLQVAGPGGTAIVFTREIPQAWKEGKQAGFTATIDGIFLKTGAPPADTPAEKKAGGKEDAKKTASPPLYFAAMRPAWHPVSEDEGAPASWVRLAKWGMDVGLFDAIKRRNRKGLGAADREAFYQMLAATGAAPAGELEAVASTDFKLPPLLVDPASQHGEMMFVEGSARKIVRIEITEADIQKRFGLTHYFEIDLLIPLGDQIIKLATGPDDDKAPEYRKHFPATICVQKLPAAWKKYERQEGAKAGELIHEQVRIPVVYFKLWSYHNEYVSQFSEDQRQPAPLFIGGMPQPVVMQRGFNMVTASLLLLLAVAAAGVFWFGLWRFRGEDSEFKKETFDKQYEVPEGKSLNHMGIKANNGPDFSNLKK